MTTEPRLDVRGLTRRFDAGRAAVEEVSFTVTGGAVTCLLGPSGCGKSTTLRMIAGVERPDAGEIRIDGRLVAGNGLHVPPEARSVGLMFQEFALFPHLDVAGNVGFGVAGGRSEKARQVEAMLDRVGLAGYGPKFPHELSGGEQQRVALVRALAAGPRVMLMDEPFSGLDNRLRDGIRDSTLELLKESGTAVLLITHEPEEAMRMADRIALMRAGRIVQEGAPLDIYNAPADPAAAAFFSDVNTIAGRVAGGRVETLFGAFAARGLAEGMAAEVLIRPQHFRLEFDRAGRGPEPSEGLGTAVPVVVMRSRFMGRDSLVDLRRAGGEEQFRAVVPGVFLPREGRALWLMAPRDRSMVFACGARTG